MKTASDNPWDFSNFSSINNTLPCFPRSHRGFIDFDKQLERPDMPLAQANEHRFISFNAFPESHSSVKRPAGNVEFTKQQGRDDLVTKKFYEKTLFQDSLYQPGHQDVIKPKLKQTLQFGQSQLARNGRSQTQEAKRAQIEKKAKREAKLSMI